MTPPSLPIPPAARGLRVALRVLDHAPWREVEPRLRRFNLDDETLAYFDAVCAALPPAVRDDLLDDPQFVASVIEHGPGVAVPVGVPSRGRPARAVAIRRAALRRPRGFVCWLVAHELAHAYLRNGGRTPGEDPEHAADALAAEWGFPRP